MNRSKLTRVILADDHYLVRSGIAALLGKHGGYDVVAEASDGMAAIEAVRKYEIDLLIVDLGMPRMGGMSVIEEVRRSKIPIKILVLSMYDNTQFVARALKAGANGYLLKQDEDLFHAIESVLDGERFVSSTIDKAALTEFAHDDAELTAREKEVLQLIGDGMTNGQIAETLFISPHTVTRHRANLMQKLNVHNRIELVKVASSRGLILISQASDI